MKILISTNIDGTYIDVTISHQFDRVKLTKTIAKEQLSEYIAFIMNNEKLITDLCNNISKEAKLN